MGRVLQTDFRYPKPRIRGVQHHPVRPRVCRSYFGCAGFGNLSERDEIECELTNGWNRAKPLLDEFLVRKNEVKGTSRVKLMTIWFGTSSSSYLSLPSPPPSSSTSKSSLPYTTPISHLPRTPHYEVFKRPQSTSSPPAHSLTLGRRQRRRASLLLPIRPPPPLPHQPNLLPHLRHRWQNLPLRPEHHPHHPSPASAVHDAGSGVSGTTGADQYQEIPSGRTRSRIRVEGGECEGGVARGRD